jgi:STE24 endopeptidase
MTFSIACNAAFLCFVLVFLLQLTCSLSMERLNQQHVRQVGRTVPPEFAGFVEEERLGRSNAYTIEKSRLAMMWKVFDDIVLLGLIVSGSLSALDHLSAKFAMGYVSAGLCFFAVVGAVFFVMNLPWEYYASFVVEEKFGFNRSDFKTWVMDHAKEAAVSLVLLAVVMGPVLWMVKAFPSSWWLWGFVAVSAFQLVLVLVYPVLIAPLFNKFEPLQDESLAEKVDFLTRSVGLTPSGIFQMDAGRRSGHSNAYFTGLGKTKRVVLFDTLLQSHSHDEILGVLAHELGHFKLKHILKSYVMSSGGMLVGFYLTYLLMNWNLPYEAFGLDPSRSYVCLFLIGIFWQRAGYFLRPCFMALSRRFERQADAFALRLQGNTDPLIAALKRLAVDNLANLCPHPWYVWFNYSHPPLAERIRFLESGTENSLPDRDANKRP